jgi:hypothetical protein
VNVTDNGGGDYQFDFTFGIPAGCPGSDGASGPPGPQGPPGSCSGCSATIALAANATATGVPCTTPAAASVAVTENDVNDFTLDFYFDLPSGCPGAGGSDSLKLDATANATGVACTAGANASVGVVENSANAYTLNFYFDIPSGCDGAAPSSCCKIPIVEVISLSSAVIYNKYLALAQTPVDPNGVMLFLHGAGNKTDNIDFQIDAPTNPNRLTWSNLDLEYVLGIGDWITVAYHYV